MGFICDVLPEIVTLEQSGGSWCNYEDKLYEIFKNEFIINIPTFMNKPIGIFTSKMYNNKEKTFWHIISEGKDEFNRNPDMRRCERIKWVREFIDTSKCINCGEIKIWKAIHKNKKMRYKIWCEKTDFIVILEERANVFMLITAYLVTYSHVRKKLKKEYENSEKIV
jgi:hypothetical protein